MMQTGTWVFLLFLLSSSCYSSDGLQFTIYDFNAAAGSFARIPLSGTPFTPEIDPLGFVKMTDGTKFEFTLLQYQTLFEGGDVAMRQTRYECFNTFPEISSPQTFHNYTIQFNVTRRLVVSFMKSDIVGVVVVVVVVIRLVRVLDVRRCFSSTKGSAE